MADEYVDKQKLDKDIKKAKSGAAEKLDNLKDEAKKTLDSVNKKDIENKINDAENAVVKFFKAVGNKLGAFANYTAESVGNGAYTAKEELKNPVVASQAVLTLGALAGGIYAYQERFRIRKIPDDVLYVYAAVATGLVVLDGFAFKKLYPKYK